MSEFGQLGLFCANKFEGALEENKNSETMSLTIEFKAPLAHKKREDLVNQITKEIQIFDPQARVDSHKKPAEKAWQSSGFLAIDVETTGLDPASNRVIELALVPFNMPEEPKPFCQLFAVGEILPTKITEITGISDDMLKGMPPFRESAEEIFRMMSRVSFVVAYNAKFDRPFLESEMARIDQVLPDVPWIDPFIFICELDRYKRGKTLSDSAKRWGVAMENAHRAMADAQAAGRLMLKMADAIGCHSIDELLKKQKILQWRNAQNMAELKRTSTWSITR